MMTYPGAPMIYYGDEIGLAGGPDPDCRRAMIWDTSRWNHDLHTALKKYIALRKKYQALWRQGTYARLYAQDKVYVFARQGQQHTLIVCRVSATPETLVDGIEPEVCELLHAPPFTVEMAGVVECVRSVRLRCGRCDLALRHLAGTVKRLLDGVEQVLVAERFRQEVDGPGFHGPHRHRDVAVTREENNGHRHMSLGQFLLQIKPA